MVIWVMIHCGVVVRKKLSGDANNKGDVAVYSGNSARYTVSSIKQKILMLLIQLRLLEIVRLEKISGAENSESPVDFVVDTDFNKNADANTLAAAIKTAIDGHSSTNLPLLWTMRL